ncbi:MAG: TetR/AcrR family transcriptional regulator [Thermodesulfobacteriota bacterium]
METQAPTHSSTFTNLPPDKQQRVTAAAIGEFAANGYQRASLNTIVRQAGIAKGSIYQYFANKEALFLHVFEAFALFIKREVKAQVGKETAADFFAHVRGVLLAGIAFIDANPQAFELYLKILFEQDVPQRERLVAQLRLFSAEYFSPLLAAAKARGDIRADADTATVIFLLDAVIERFLQGYAKPYLDSGLELARKKQHQLLEEIDGVIAILRDGLAPADKGA